MTISAAQNIMQLQVLNCGGGTWKAVDGKGIPLVEVRGVPDYREACDKLVRKNWNRVAYLALERDEYRCVECKTFRTLGCHHIQFRSHGRRDVLENLETLCAGCHEKKHKAKRATWLK